MTEIEAPAEIEQISTETYPLLCRRCREEITFHSDIYEICTDCYLRLDLARFIDDPRHVPRRETPKIPRDVSAGMLRAYEAYGRMREGE